ncbi:MAG: cytochrome d ubiquinol oxidase subunit II [Peptococcaceae bacterium]|nr:cytochrome d ubiquinol oxidase subunit II [Peptococcaceae bacterium]
MEVTLLQVLWFLLVGVVMLVYSLLGGYDIGVGSLYLFSSKKQRPNMIEKVGPFWDANTIWLITLGGGIAASFPAVFAVTFSGYYLAIMLVLVALIMRIVAIEFRYQLNTPGWSKVWDACFGLGSILLPVLLGVALGNAMRGLPLIVNEAGYPAFEAGKFFSLLNPYSVLVGVFALVFFAWHGCNYLNATGNEDVRASVRKKGPVLAGVSLALFLVIGIYTFMGGQGHDFLAGAAHLSKNFMNFPPLFVFPLLAVGGMLFYFMAGKESKIKPLFASIFASLGVVGTVGASLFPRLIPNSMTVDKYNPTGLTDFTSEHLTANITSSTMDPTLTIANAANTEPALLVGLIIALLGVVIMLPYTIFVYRKFLKKAKDTSAAVSSGASRNV